MMRLLDTRAGGVWTSGLRRRPARVGRGRFVPQVGRLEGRALLSTLTVTTTADSGTGSLRRAVEVAVRGDTIDVSPALAGGTITFGSEIAVEKDLTIAGPGADRLTLSGGGVTRLFNITGRVYVNLSGLTLANGSAPLAGGVLMAGNGLTVADCVFRDNQAVGVNGGDGEGGALYQGSGFVSVLDTAFQGNRAQGGDGVDPAAPEGGQGRGGAVYLARQEAS